MKLRADSLKRKTRLTYLQLDSLRKKRAQINKVRNKRQKIMVDATEIQRITREYYEELHTKKLENPEERDTSLGSCCFRRLKCKETENLNRTSLVAQWLRIRLAMPQSNYPMCQNHCAHTLQPLKPLHLEPTLHNEITRHSEKPEHGS